MAQTLTERADKIVEKLQDLAIDAEDNGEAVTKIEELIESLREINFADAPDEDEEGTTIAD
jgi:hypothetical protein